MQSLTQLANNSCYNKSRRPYIMLKSLSVTHQPFVLTVPPFLLIILTIPMFFWGKCYCFFSRTRRKATYHYILRRKKKVKNPHTTPPRGSIKTSYYKKDNMTMTLKWHTGKEVVNALASPGSSDGSQHWLICLRNALLSSSWLVSCNSCFKVQI